MDSNADIKQVHVKGVYIIDTPVGTAPAILLVDDAGLLMPIYIGRTEALSINAVLKNETMPRPLTHDLMISILKRLGAEVESVFIDDKIDNIYYACLSLKKDNSLMEFDVRPSDGIALALRHDAPIWIKDEVLKCAVVDKEMLVGAKTIDSLI